MKVNVKRLFTGAVTTNNPKVELAIKVTAMVATTAGLMVAAHLVGKKIEASIPSITE